jgi:hypothetical protein
MTPDALQWRIDSGRWQQPCRGVVVTHHGPLTHQDKLWVACLWGGPGAVLSGLTAARLWGLRWLDANADAIELIVPPDRQRRLEPPRMRLITHYSRYLAAADVDPARQPPRASAARALADAVAWRHTDRGARDILAAGIDQGLVRPGDLVAVLARNERLHRRKLMLDTVADIVGETGALPRPGALAELRG